jgi:hypothetical protein
MDGIAPKRSALNLRQLRGSLAEARAYALSVTAPGRRPTRFLFLFRTGEPMLRVKRGDQLPSVAMCQALLNGDRGDTDQISVDGIFGQQTQRAVREFQAKRRVPLTQMVDRATWHALSDQNALQVHDHVDIFDPMLRQSARVIEAAGARPAFSGGTCNGVAALLGELRSSGIGAGRLVVLRFHGHGNRGVQAVAYGSVAHVYFDALLGQAVPSLHHLPAVGSLSPSLLGAAAREALHSQISTNSLREPDILFELSLLKPLFHPSGSVEFHGCQVGGGQVGRSMLRKFADTVGVPAVGARIRQLTSDAVEFSGPVEVECPRGLSLRQWAKNLRPIRSSPGYAQAGAG